MILYFNVCDLEGRTGNDGTGIRYKNYCREFATVNGMEFVEYDKFHEYDEGDLETGEYIDGDNNSSSGLRLWEDFCANRKIVKHELT